MPSVVVVASQPAPGEDHPRVTISGLTGTVVLDVTSPETEFGGLADELATLARPHDRPILVRQARNLATMSIEATIGSELRRGTRDVEPDLAALVGMARGLGRSPNPVRVVYSRLDTWLALTGRWVISDLRIKIKARAPGTNAATRADVTISLTEESPSPAYATVTPGSTSLPVAPPAPPPAAAVRAPAPAPPPAQRRHTVRRGDTLYEIAARYYNGDHSRWRAIAAANNIRDPRQLAVGQVLVLP